MHDTAQSIGAAFLKQYSRPRHVIVEIGAYNVNGSIRPYAHPKSHYIGIDIEEGPGVDLVAPPGRELPVRSQSADIIVATSVFEHDGFFWKTFLEMCRVIKDGGVIYINAPSNGLFHRYPTDNWRFYPDAGKMLEKWGIENSYSVSLIESFVAERKADGWNDFVAIFQRAPVKKRPKFLSDTTDCTNVWQIGKSEMLRIRTLPEDMVMIEQLRRELQVRQSPVESPAVANQRLFIEYLRRSGTDTRKAEERLSELLQA